MLYFYEQHAGEEDGFRGQNRSTDMGMLLRPKAWTRACSWEPAGYHLDEFGHRNHGDDIEQRSTVMTRSNGSAATKQDLWFIVLAS